MVPQEWIDLVEKMSYDELLYWLDYLRCKQGYITVDELCAAHPRYASESRYYFTKGDCSNV